MSISRLITCAFASIFATTGLAARPNVVVFVADDLGWRDLGYAGSTFYESPNIDKLAARGVVFTNAYSACAVCSPTRAALMTGKYPQRVGVTNYIGGPQPDVAATQPKYADRLLPAAYKTNLALEETTIGEVLRDAGYATYFTGKWHLGGAKFYPDKQGFDLTNGSSGAGSPGKDGYFTPYNVPVTTGPAGEHLDLRLATDAAKWIGQQKPDKPFLLWFCLYDVHVPLQAPAATIEYFEAKKKKLGLSDDFADEGKSRVRLTQCHTTYAAMVKTMDDAVGIVVKQLEAQHLEDDTIIIFTSDNGGLSTAEGAPTSNLPLRAGKGWAYEGGIRVPLIAIVPGISRAGTTCSERAISMDLNATIQAACGVANAGAPDGINLLPALRNEKLPERNLFWHYPHYGNQGGAPYSAILSGDYKLIAFHDPRQGVELYNLKSDPGEKTNLAASDPAKVQELAALLDRWKHEVGAIDATAR